MKKPFGFPKSEKLCSKKDIKGLFENGDSVFLYPYKIYYLKKDIPHYKVLILSPKKRIKKSVDRKKVLRRIREAFRLQKKIFFEEISLEYGHLGIVYVGTVENEFTSLFTKLKQAIERLKHKVKEKIDI